MRVPTKLLSLLAVIIVLATATGCDSGNGGNNQALTENDFANNPSLRADPDKQDIVDFLEPPGSDTPQYDTGPVGIDEIPVTYTKAESHTFCWKDDNSEAMDYMVLLDSEGKEVLRVDVNGDCVTDTIEPGDYVMELHHDGSMETEFPIFIIPQIQGENGGVKAKKDESMPGAILARAERALFSIIEKLDITQTTNAQTVQDNIATLLSTKSCPGCNLSGANLSNAQLNGVDLSGANLRGAKINRSDMIRANLTDTNFLRADLRESAFAFADFTDAQLIEADMSRSDLFNVSFRKADMFSAKLDGARLTGADLSGANLVRATWCNGCVCLGRSLPGTCEGCPSVKQVCSEFPDIQ